MIYLFNFYTKDTKIIVSFRVCLFGGEIGWIENFGEKIGMKIFWSVFGWVGERKINGEARVFSFRAHQKVFSPK